MPERDLFDQLADLPAEGPRAGFVEHLERRLVEASTDVGPATPTDHEIEGVVLMPESETLASPPRPWVIAAVAAAVVILVLVVFTSLDEQSTSPVDVVTEPEPLPAEPVLPSTDATPLVVAQAWMQAIADEDDATFRALHTDNARVKGSVFRPGAPSGTLNSLAMADQYFGGWEAFLAFNEAWGTSGAIDPGECEAAGEEVTCTSVNPLFPESILRVRFVATLETTAGRVSAVTTDFLLIDTAGADAFADREDLSPEASEALGAQFTECDRVQWNAAECGPRMGEFWIALWEATGDDESIRPDG